MPDFTIKREKKRSKLLLKSHDIRDIYVMLNIIMTQTLCWNIADAHLTSEPARSDVGNDFYRVLR